MVGGRGLAGRRGEEFERHRQEEGKTKPSSPSACPPLPSPLQSPITGSSACHQYAAGPLLSSTRPRPLNTLPPLWGSGLRGIAPPNPPDNLGFLLLPRRAENK